MPVVTDGKLAVRRKNLRWIWGSLGAVTLIFSLVGYIRVRLVLKNYALFHAIQSDNLVAARAAIRHGADVNAYVSQDEVEDLVDALVGRRLDDFPELTPLLTFAASCQIDMVQLLVSHGTVINVTHCDDSPLVAAVLANNTDNVRYLVVHGADVNAATGGDNTPLLDLAQHKPEIRRILVAAGAHE